MNTLIFNSAITKDEEGIYHFDYDIDVADDDDFDIQECEDYDDVIG